MPWFGDPDGCPLPAFLVPSHHRQVTYRTLLVLTVEFTTPAPASLPCPLSDPAAPALSLDKTLTSGPRLPQFLRQPLSSPLTGSSSQGHPFLPTKAASHPPPIPPGCSPCSPPPRPPAHHLPDSHPCPSVLASPKPVLLSLVLSSCSPLSVPSLPLSLQPLNLILRLCPSVPARPCPLCPLSPLYLSSHLLSPILSPVPSVWSSVLCPQLRIPQRCPPAPAASAPQPQASGSRPLLHPTSPGPWGLSRRQSLSPKPRVPVPKPRVPAPVALRVEEKEVEPRSAGAAPPSPGRPRPAAAAAHLRRAPRTRRWLPPPRP